MESYFYVDSHGNDLSEHNVLTDTPIAINSTKSKSGQEKPSSTYTGNSNINATNKKTVTLTAQWSLTSYVKNFDYTGREQTWTAPETGYYKLEVWGAQGGYASYNITRLGGYGGYAVGVVKVNKNDKAYVYIGGKGGSTSATDSGGSADGYTGFNGGGVGSIRPTNSTHGGGGGATHIATKSGQLQALASYKDTGGTNISKEILVVAGGGGGASQHMDYSSGNWSGVGGHGGGYIGGDGNRASTVNTGYGYGTGGTQTQKGVQAIKTGHCDSNFAPYKTATKCVSTVEHEQAWQKFLCKRYSTKVKNGVVKQSELWLIPP